MMTYGKLMHEGRQRMLACGQSDQSAMFLLSELCRKKGVNLYMEIDSHPDEQLQTEYLEGLHRMEKGEPLGYVLGYEPFYGRDFDVNENVLIPRPETEELVSLVLSTLDENFSDIEHPVVFDVACGSGAIGISLSLEDDRLDLYASDISRDALEVAWHNNKKLEGRVNFLCGDMLEPFIDHDLHCDFLVCNPPYIPEEEDIESSVRDYEPNVALFGGKDGLKFYRQVFERAGKVLNDGGALAFEMGWNQGERLMALAREYFDDADIQIFQDINGKDRMLRIQTKRKEVQ